jgi:alkylhydroperoxidase family enzyme
LVGPKLGLVDPDQLMPTVLDGTDAADRAVMAFAAKVARDAATVTAADVQELRDVGLSDDDVLDVALAAAARCFFATALDAVGAQADRELADALGPQLSALLTVGRPVATRAT